MRVFLPGILSKVSTTFSRSVFLLLTFGAMLAGAASGHAQTTATNIQVTSAVQQASVKRLGINLADQTFYDSGQMLKNLVFQNPGFEAEKYRSIMICYTVSANTCTDDNQYSPQPTGFWTGGTYTMLSGKSAGMTGTIVSSTKNPNSCAGCGQIIQFDQNINAAAGDYFVLTTTFPGNGDAGWWDGTGGGGTITTETTDLSPETPGKQALLLNGSATGASAAVTQYFDGEDGLSFIQLNGNFAVTFRAKGVGGSNKLSVNVTRVESTGNVVYLNQTVNLTNTWQDYTLTFSANETGSSVGTVQLVFGAYGSSVELDDVSLAQTNSSASNPTAFRDDVVNTLEQLNPGTIRMMAGAALGVDLPNQMQVPFARYREGFYTGSTSEAVIAYGVHEFLQLCQTVGADPWITIPTATTPAEMTDFIQYLTGTGSDPWSALRISRGQSAPWTSVFNKIHIELGNETWNGSFRGESMNATAYPGWANQIFGAARQTSGYQASKFDLVLSGFISSGYDQQLLTTSTQHDSIDMAPYLLMSANDEPMSTMFGALYAEPEMWSNPGGGIANIVSVVQAAPTKTNLNIYETNLSPIEGNVTETELNELTPSVGAGIGHAVHMLEMMRLGVQYQNAFALPQYNFMRSDGNPVKLWGVVFDMGTTNRRRPQFLTEMMANSVIGGNMLQTVQTGANPTWNQPLSSDSVQLNGAHYLQSFAFQNGSTQSTVLFNLNQTTALPVTFSGANAPTGSVQMTQLTSVNITDNNETSTVVQPTSQTLSGFSAATGISLPPFSMTVLSWTTGPVTQIPLFSVAGGTYTSAQTVSLSDATSGAMIYYTTDGSTPTTASSVYATPLTVTGTETINALAVASGFGPSQVASASYQVASPAAATPVFSVAAGTYPSAQTVSITDATSGATIYYTTNGAAPTTSSSVYSGPITVGTTETLQAAAIAANSSLSAVASATYTINSPAAATPVFSVAAGTYSTAQTVSISDATSGATIYYTTNGAAPTTSASVYSGPITVSATETLQATAVAANSSLSAVASATYTITSSQAAPAFSIASGTYTGTQTVSITDATPSSTIYYQLNNTGAAVQYSGPITVSQSESISAVAFGPSYAKSTTVTVSYVIVPQAASPVFSVAAGTYTSAQTVTIADATSGATIYYTTNGAVPTTSSSVYGGPITVGASETLHAIAAAANYGNSAVASAAYTINLPAATPSFSVAAGTYTSAQTVSITDATAGATIYYTTNGAAPTTSSSVYSGPITVGATETLQAAAIASNSSLSAVATAAYTINLPAATPSFSVAAGTYTSAQTVTIADATAGATIYYTTNGAAPTTSSSVYSGPITVGATETLQAAAIGSNSSLSAVASAAYIINLPAATPSFSVAAGTYTSAQTVSITDATAGATIYYTTNGAAPTTSSSVYSGPITVGATETLQAAAIASNSSLSAVATAAYTINLPAATPSFSVAAGTYTSAQTVSITDATAGATIYYTTNGAAPTTSSSVYSGPITVGATETLQAAAIGSNSSLSAVASAAYIINLPAATPSFSVAAGTYTSAQTVSITDATAGATIYYTTNGAAPTTSSSVYSGPITVGATETLQAAAIAANSSLSAVATAAYTINLPAATPSFSVAAGTYTSAQTVSITDATAGATIYYTTNGAAPTTSSSVYSGPITVGATETLQAAAIAANSSLSAVATAAYTINLPAATPNFSVAAGTYTSAQTVTIADATAGATIYYTTNGAAPTTSSSVYSGPITVGATETLQAAAIAANSSLSAVASAAYTINLPAATPSFSVAAGSYTSAQTVTIADATAGATIYYTTNGTAPTTASSVYSGPITVAVGTTETLKAVAIAPNSSLSAAASAAYTISGQAAPSFSIASGTYTGTQTVTLTEATAGSAVYYQINNTGAAVLYSAPFTVSKSETVSAVSFGPSYVKSSTVAMTYTIVQ